MIISFGHLERSHSVFEGSHFRWHWCPERVASVPSVFIQSDLHVTPPPPHIRTESNVFHNSVLIWGARFSLNMSHWSYFYPKGAPWNEFLPLPRGNLQIAEDTGLTTSLPFSLLTFPQRAQAGGSPSPGYSPLNICEMEGRLERGRVTNLFCTRLFRFWYQIFCNPGHPSIPGKLLWFQGTVSALKWNVLCAINHPQLWACQDG